MNAILDDAVNIKMTANVIINIFQNTISLDSIVDTVQIQE